MYQMHCTNNYPADKISCSFSQIPKLPEMEVAITGSHYKAHLGMWNLSLKKVPMKKRQYSTLQYITIYCGRNNCLSS